jgi:endoglucanase
VSIRSPRAPHRFGKTYIGKYSTSVPDAAPFYRSANMYDDLSVAATWLHIATGNATYLSEATAFFAKHIAEEGSPWNNFGWDTQTWAAAILLAKTTQQSSYNSRIQVRVGVD